MPSSQTVLSSVIPTYGNPASSGRSLERLITIRVVWPQTKEPFHITEVLLKSRDGKEGTYLVRVADNALEAFSLGPSKEVHSSTGAVPAISLHICPSIALEINL